MGKAGFGKEPKSYAVRITVVGQASPRWNGASSPAEADRQNARLANQRAEHVRQLVESQLRAALGETYPVESSVSRPDGEKPRGLGIGDYGVGSRESMRNSGGDRKNNDAIYRSVEVRVERITTEYRSGGRSVPLKKYSSNTRFWYVTIRKLLVSGIVIPGYALGWTEIEIMNSMSKKKARYRAALYGGGDPMPADTPDKNVGRREAPLVTDKEMGFDDFDGESIRISRMDVQLLAGLSAYWLAFPNLGKGAFNSLGKEFGLGFPGGYIVSGTLRMIGDNPGDYYEDPESGEEVANTSWDHSQTESLLLTFPTGSASLPPAEATRLHQFTAAWGRRLGPT